MKSKQTAQQGETSFDAPFLTVSNAARYMGVGKKIIYQLIEFGEIQAIRQRSVVLVDRSSLDEFRRSGKLT